MGMQGKLTQRDVFSRVVIVNPSAYDPVSAAGGRASIVTIQLAPATEPVTEAF